MEKRNAKAFIIRLNDVDRGLLEAYRERHNLRSTVGAIRQLIHLHAKQPKVTQYEPGELARQVQEILNQRRPS